MLLSYFQIICSLSIYLHGYYVPSTMLVAWDKEEKKHNTEFLTSRSLCSSLPLTASHCAWMYSHLEMNWYKLHFNLFLFAPGLDIQLPSWHVPWMTSRVNNLKTYEIEFPNFHFLLLLHLSFHLWCCATRELSITQGWNVGVILDFYFSCAITIISWIMVHPSQSPVLSLQNLSWLHSSFSMSTLT